MCKGISDSKHSMRADMTILDVVSQYRQTEAVFRKYDETAGVCLCCDALFESLQAVSEKYGLNLDKLLEDLEFAANLK